MNTDRLLEVWHAFIFRLGVAPNDLPEVFTPSDEEIQDAQTLVSLRPKQRGIKGLCFLVSVAKSCEESQVSAAESCTESQIIFALLEVLKEKFRNRFALYTIKLATKGGDRTLFDSFRKFIDEAIKSNRIFFMQMARFPTLPEELQVLLRDNPDGQYFVIGYLYEALRNHILVFYDNLGKFKRGEIE